MSTLSQINDFARRSATLKLLGVGLLGLFLLIPAYLVDDLIRERQNLRDDAVLEIGAQWGQAQRLAGPIIQVPYQTQTTVDNKVVTQRGEAYLLPATVDIDVQLVPETRKRSIYAAVLYEATVRVTGRFDSLAVSRLGVPVGALDFTRASLSFGVEDVRGIDSLSQLTLGGQRTTFEPGLPQAAVLYSGFQAPIQLTGGWTGGDFAFELRVRGSSSIGFSPLASQTDVTLGGNWGDPKFSGAFLPDERTVEADAFSAHWSIVEVNRPLPRAGLIAAGQGGQGPYDGGITRMRYSNDRMQSYASYDYDIEPATAVGPALTSFGDFDFGADLLLPVDDYRKTYRSARYSALFIAASFLTFFFIEALNRKRLHLIQYLLIGAAVVLFYVLLLSLSEHIGFDLAYALSVLLILGLIGGYSYAVLDSTRLTGLVVGILALLYGFFYSLLQLEDYSLLLGSFGLLLALAVIMYLTRRTNWSGGVGK